MDKKDILCDIIFGEACYGGPGSMNVSKEKDIHGILSEAAEGDEIILPEGDFRIKTALFSPNVTIHGKGMDKTRIIWDDYAEKRDENGIKYDTFKTFTLAVCADNITITDLSVINDAGSPEINGQEVALTVYGDNFRMERCRLSSTQDTLFLGPLPYDLTQRYRDLLPEFLRKSGVFHQYFRDCLIEGTVDFIFGCGKAVFEDCEIKSLYDSRGIGYIAAPAHPLSEKNGFIFKNCRMTASDEVAESGVYLARPWRDYGLCAFIDCDYGEHISPFGFDKWNDTDRDKTARFYEKPSIPGRVPWVKELKN